jgi:acyl carrier protein
MRERRGSGQPFRIDGKIMDRKEILKEVSALLGDIVDEDGLELTEESTADDVAEWDSTNHVRLMIAIESAFGIRFESDEIASPENVGALLDLIEAKQKA